MTTLQVVAMGLALSTCATASAQLTIKVVTVPMNTPANSTLYVAGNFNSWNPADPNRVLNEYADGKYSITLNPSPGEVEFKITRGSWGTVEGNIGGLVQPAHKVFYNGQPKTVEIAILSWPDLLNGGNNGIGPNTGSVAVLSNNYFIPQLNRTRRIWAYLPPDYGINPGKRYPVLYMQDGQNLFDPTDTNDWQVDESMNELVQGGDHGCIIIGIDNGGVYQNDEYAPWVNPSLGGGEGKEYVEFIVNTLKPYIDNNYLTISDREHTGIMGSAMGGLISMYAIVEYQNVFSKAGVFSPLFSFNGNEMAQHILSVGKLSDVRVFFLAGAQEPTYISQCMEQVIDAMYQVGFDGSEINISTPVDGDHSTWFWAREFPTAYTWLFENTQPSVPTYETEHQTLDIQVFPNPSTDWVRVKGEEVENEQVFVQIIGMDGRVWYQNTQMGNELIPTTHLPQGAFSLSVTDAQGRSRATQLIHE